jgi:protein-disulfide isomerase
MAPHRRLGLVFFALIAAAGLRAASAAPKADPAPLLAPEMVLGNPKAKVTVIEYASASCPHCAHFNNDIFPEFKKAYIDTGKVRYVFREMLTDPAPFAGAAFLIARCAGPGQYFPVLDTVFHEQDAIYQSGDLAGGLLKIAEQYGLSKEQVASCTADEKSVQALNDRMAQADKDGVNSTPTFLIGDKRIEGAQPLADFQAVIDPMLAK